MGAGMKCLVLAGGSGDRLWPLSRKNYPKQFMEIHKNRSLLQETVTRNMPFCEEFFIATNWKYHYIAEGQMKSFQGLKYRMFYEEIARKTAAAIAMVCFQCNASEFLFVVAADHFIKGNGYQEAIIRCKELAEQGYLVSIGIEALGPNTEFGYICHRGEEVEGFREKPDLETAKSYIKKGTYLWNSGMFLFETGVFLEELKIYSPEIYYACKEGAKKVKRGNNSVIIPEGVLLTIPEICVEKAVFEHSKKMKTVQREFEWWDIGHIEDMEKFSESSDFENSIQEDCINTTVLNRSKRNIVVTNGLKNIMVVNTDDAVYIGEKGLSPQLKTIVRENKEEYGHYFEDNKISYRPWGMYEVLNSEPNYKVKKLTIFPGETIYAHKHAYRSEHWSIVEGKARVSIDGTTRDYEEKESIDVAVGVSHQVSNVTRENLIIIEVAVGESVTEKDIISLQSMDVSEKELGFEIEDIVELEPAYKDYLWGGNKLKKLYGKKCDYGTIAESWELSGHEAGESIISSGRYKGVAFGHYLKKIGWEALGWKCENYEKFPLLIKFIDAKEDLSVQVHPGDEYAIREEGEYGKNEMWYIAHCKEGAKLYCGLKEKKTKEEIKKRVEKGTIMEVMKEFPVKQGDVFFIEAGTIHAIGEGIVIYEIQQSSNSTYRLYDYGRKDRFGNFRELHLEKALKVANMEPYDEWKFPCKEEVEEGYTKQILGQCKYFESIRYTIKTQAEIEVEDASFSVVSFLEGFGEIKTKTTCLRFYPGKTYFIAAGKKKVMVQGECQFIMTHI
jgi:mannose-1-phosphate guanylyltransferase/mannose-6-phosphate isomerase